MRTILVLFLAFSFGLLAACGGGNGGTTMGTDDDGGTDDGGMTGNPDAPTVASVNPPRTSNFGGTQITIMGTNFVAGSTVTVGGTPATNINIVNATTITCTTPAGGAGAAPVVVTNADGSDSGAFDLFEPILVAEGGGSPAPAVHNLWAFDVATGFAHIVGPIGFGVTCMDFQPGTGTLYGATAPGSAGGLRQLITINPVTGAGTAVGLLNDGGANNHIVQGMTFVGATLYGASFNFASIVTIAPATGVVTPGFANAVNAPGGGGMASDVANNDPFYTTNDTGPIATVNIGGTAVNPLFLASGFSFPGALKSATFHQGLMYALDAENSTPGQPSAQQIVSVNTGTGQLTPVGNVLPFGFGSAIASRTR